MSEFASCYFCGDAVDADVRGYPVVPEDADAPTVDLCPTCHRKLTNVLETVLSSVGDGAAAVDGPEGERAAEDSPPGVEGPALDTGSDLLHDIDDPVAGEGDGPTRAGAADGAGGEPVAGAADGADAGAGPDTGADGEPQSADAAPGGVADTTGDAGPESAEDSPADEGAAPETADADGHETGRSGTPEDGSTGDRNGAADPETASLLTTPTAKKVVKLLQNRTFPVDREEFTVVASNAYDIPMGECEDVVDALVAEGYVAAEGGQLVQPAE